MSRHSIVDEIPKRGDLVEITIESTGNNHLGKKYNWIYEFCKVTRIIKNRRGEVVAMRLKGSGEIKIIKVSRKKNCFYTTIGKRRHKLELEIIPEEE